MDDSSPSMRRPWYLSHRDLATHPRAHMFFLSLNCRWIDWNTKNKSHCLKLEFALLWKRNSQISGSKLIFGILGYMLIRNSQFTNKEQLNEINFWMPVTVNVLTDNCFSWWMFRIAIYGFTTLNREMINFLPLYKSFIIVMVSLCGICTLGINV